MNPFRTGSNYYNELYAPAYDGPAYTYPNYGYTDIYTPETLQHLRDVYAAEVTLTDRWVGHLLRQIDVMGLYANTCVILTSDHGMYIGEHGRTGKHTVDETDPWPIYDTVGRVPLLVRTPFESAPRTVRALCQSADIMPTVTDLPRKIRLVLLCKTLIVMMILAQKRAFFSSDHVDVSA